MSIDILSALAVVLGLVGAVTLWLGERQSFTQLKLGGVGMMVVAIGALLLGAGPSRPLGGGLSLLEETQALVKAPGLAVELGLDPAGASSGGSLSPAGETGYFTISGGSTPLPFRVPDSPNEPRPDPGPGPDPDPDPDPEPTPLPDPTEPPKNEAPVASGDSATTPEGNSVTVNVLANDSDPDGDPLTVSGLSNPPNGSVSNDGGGSVTYTPGPGFIGNDSFTYDACDPDGLCDQATVSITVTAVNEAPVANGDSATTPQDTQVEIDVLANDSDPDGDSLSISNLSDPPNGSVSGGSTVTYTPDLGFVGDDSFTYEACDPGGLCNQATVSVTVTGSLGVHLI